MATQIRPNRLEVSDRFPMLGFTVRTDGSAKRYEIAIGTSPDLFGPDGKAQRNRMNFFSTRAAGSLPIERGEAVYVLPPEILTRFIGQQKLYYGLATYQNGVPSSAEVVTMPGSGSPYISLTSLTGRSLQRVRVLPSRQRAAATYGKTNGSELEWAGDAAAPGTQPAAPPAAKGAPAKAGNGSASAAAVHYDDGYGPLPPSPPPQSRKSTPVPQAKSLSDDIPLDPGIGGQSIMTSVLEIGDIILSTTDHITSTVIRVGSGSQVSHAMLYVGQGDQVVEAVGGGVRLVPLADAIADATVAVAFRVPGLTSDQKQIIADKVAAYIGRDYDYVGVVRQGAFQIHRRVCGLLPDGARQNCENWAGRIDLGRGGSTDFFCSQLVIQAFADAGVPLTSQPANWSSPQDIAQLFFRDGALAYVGHLKAPPAGRSLLDVFGLSLAAAAPSPATANGGAHDHHRRKHHHMAHAEGVLDWAADRVTDAIRSKFQSATKRPYSFPQIRVLNDAESQTVQTALRSSIVSGALGAIQSLLARQYSVGLGFSGGVGLFAGASAGAGIVFTSDGHFGIYGEAQISEGMFEEVAAHIKITIVKGGVEAFNGPSVSAGIELGAGIGGSIEVLGDDTGNILGIAVGVTGGEEVGAFVSQGIGWAVQLFSESTVPVRVMTVRAMDSDLQPAQLPTARRLSGWEKALVRTAIDAVVGTGVPMLPQLIQLVNAGGYSVGLGLGGDAGLLGGGGLGFGIILAPNEDVGVFGSVEIRAGLLAGLGAGARVIVVRGGIETFNETGYAVGVTIEEEASISVIALFNAQRQFHGVSFQLGVGLSLSPVQIFTATEHSVSTAVTQSLGADDDDHGMDEPLPDDSGAQSQALDATAEYPGALDFQPAASVNYRAGSGTRTINRIVIHITAGGLNYRNTVSWFQNPHQTNARGNPIHVSAHYVVGRQGEVVQMVKNNDIAWHASRANGDSIGIEHNATTHDDPTDAQYAASAALVQWLAGQFNIPLDRDHIKGHKEVSPQDNHECPGRGWDWDKYMGLVTAGSSSSAPAQEESLAFQTPSVRLPAPPRKVSKAKSLAAPSSIGNSPVNTVTGGEGNITWELDQFPGMKMAAQSAVGPMQSAETIRLSNWPYCDHANGSRAAAWFSVDWKFSGQALGQIRITPSGTQQGAQPLRVEARIEDGRNRDASTVSIAVRFTYHFSTSDGPEVVAVTELILYSDGTIDQKSNWAAQAAA
jgi:uncharacterized protein YycO